MTVFITCFPLFCYLSLLLDYIIGLPGACNFNMEDDRWEQICQLSQDPDDDFDWRIGHRTETGVGPQSDHSPGLHMYWNACFISHVFLKKKKKMDQNHLAVA